MPATAVPSGAKIFGRRDQRADCSAALHKPRARHELAFSGWQQAWRASVCARRRTLRSGSNSLSASLRPPLHLPRSPTTDRSQTIHINRQSDEFANQRLANSDFPIADCKIGAIREKGGRVTKSSGLVNGTTKQSASARGWIPARSPRPVYVSPAPVKVVRKNEPGTCAPVFRFAAPP